MSANSTNTSNELKELLKYLDIMLADLTPLQISNLEKYASEIKDVTSITPQKAFSVVKELGLDIEKLQKNARRHRAEQIKNKIKIGVNDLCICGSGKKYKKCCRLNTVTNTNVL